MRPKPNAPYSTDAIPTSEKPSSNWSSNTLPPFGLTGARIEGEPVYVRRYLHIVLTWGNSALIMPTTLTFRAFVSIGCGCQYKGMGWISLHYRLRWVDLWFLRPFCTQQENPVSANE